MNQLPLGLARDPQNPALVAKLNELQDYDFTPVREALQSREEWSEEKIQDAEVGAKRFFALRFLDPDNEHVPCPGADEVWHYMVVDTRWYRQFCDDVFGSFLDHVPWTGPDSPEKEEKRALSRGLYGHWFGLDDCYRAFKAESVFGPGCGTCHFLTLSAELKPSPGTMYPGPAAS